MAPWEVVVMAVSLAMALTAGVEVATEDVASALIADDGACEAGSGGDAPAECLELRQLRAREAKAAVAAHDLGEVAAGLGAAQASFGPDAEGEDMWEERTWTDVLLEIQASMNSTEACQEDTYGTCSLFSCGESRGMTKCKDGKCLCEEGHCAMGGTCFPKSVEHCASDTSGTCAYTSCASSRGYTKCSKGKCLCATGGCAWKGACFPVTDTGGSCRAMGCAASRGPVTCHRGKCLCKNGYVSLSGRCERFDV